MQLYVNNRLNLFIFRLLTDRQLNDDVGREERRDGRERESCICMYERARVIRRNA